MNGTNAAIALVNRLKSCKTSPTVLFWLKLRKQTLEQTELGTFLLKLCYEMRVDAANLDPSFFQEVTKVSHELKPVCPDFFVVDPLKLNAIDRFRDQLRRRRAMESCGDQYHYMGAHMPFCFQCLCPKSAATTNAFAGALFFIFAAPEDGLRAILKIVRGDGLYHHRDSVRVFSQVYEHRIGAGFLSSGGKSLENRLGYIMLDWEIQESKLIGRLTREEIRRLCMEFPLWFYQQMHDKLLVDPDTFVTAVLKHKSRNLPDGDYKHSIHVVFECAGVPSSELKYVCHRVFEDFRQYLDESKRSKSFDCIPDNVLRAATWIGADIPTMGGQTGFAMMFSKKSQSDPFACLDTRTVYHRGSVYALPANAGGVKNPKPFTPRPTSKSGGHDPQALSIDESLHLLYQASCSVPRGYTCRLSKQAEENAKTLQSRTAAKFHTASKNGVGGRQFPTRRGDDAAMSSSVLPGWMSLVLDGSKRYMERVDSAQSYLKQLMKLLGDEEKAKGSWVAVHVGNEAMPCPMMLSQDPPVKYSHTSNGVILAVLSGDDSVVYARCTACQMSKTTNAHVERVVKAFSGGCGGCGGCGGEEAAGDPSPWVKFTEKGLGDLMLMPKAEKG